MPPAAERRLFWGAAAAVITLDALTKWLAESRLLHAVPVEIIGSVVQLRLVYNPGAAFGLHLGPWSRWIFLAVAIIAVVVLARMSRETAAGRWGKQLVLGLIAGGATGNLIDRVRSSRGVVDFLDVGVGLTRWPTFNVADVAVSCGAVALAVILWREDDERARAASESAPAA